MYVDPHLPRHIFGWYSHRLDLDMPIVSYGYRGHPLLLLPTSDGITGHPMPRICPRIGPGEPWQSEPIRAAVVSRSAERAFPGTAGPDVRAPGFRSGGPRAEVEENRR